MEFDEQLISCKKKEVILMTASDAFVVGDIFWIYDEVTDKYFKFLVKSKDNSGIDLSMYPTFKYEYELNDADRVIRGIPIDSFRNTITIICNRPKYDLSEWYDDYITSYLNHVGVVE